MLPATIVQHYDQKRLRNVLLLLFVALVVPTAVIIWQAYGQLKWEAFYQYRAQAEALSERIDNDIARGIMVASDRTYADFQYLNVASGGKVLQRSPLAEFPANQDVPGTIGHFQVDENGAFSTPLIPTSAAQPAELGLDSTTFEQRAALAAEIRQILSENKLVNDRDAATTRLPANDAPIKLDEIVATGLVLQDSTMGEVEASQDQAEFDDDPDRNAAGAAEEVAYERSADTVYSQDVFEALNSAPSSAPTSAASTESVEGAAKRENARSLGRVEDLRLDEDLQKKSIAADKENTIAEEEKRQRGAPLVQTRRIEQVALPVPQPSVESPRRETTSTDDNLAITTFASEIDPYEFSLLDSGHLVLFRNVWRDNERTIQGLLIDRNRFAEVAIENAFRSTTLAQMSNLVVGYQGDIIHATPGGGEQDYLRASNALQDSLLYRRTLTAPFDGLELVYSINQLPRGPGATVLAWSTVVIGIVFLAGFFALYRLGMSQLRLARQQQDFVSAVSHELKTPLTSIRMYSEMLKEGWADEKKQTQYYEFIHDESERLTRLITNVLQLAKISRSDPEFDLQATQVGELISQIESKITSQVERAGFELTIERDSNLEDARINVDSDCFAQVVINLVDNAIKFSRDAPRKSIEIVARQSKDNTVTFTVRDFGPGIPKNQMKKIFQLFYRTESELTRETVGTGIGLAIVHQLVSAMKGRVDVINRDPGAQFDVSFPQV